MRHCSRDFPARAQGVLLNFSSSSSSSRPEGVAGADVCPAHTRLKKAPTARAAGLSYPLEGSLRKPASLPLNLS